MLQTLNPSVSDSIYRTSQNVTEAEKIYSQSIKELLNKVLIKNKLDIEELKKTPSPKSLLFEILTPLGFNSSTIDDVYQSIDSIPGKKFFSDSNMSSNRVKHRLIKDRNYFILDVIKEDTEDSEIYYIEKEDREITHPLNLNVIHVKYPVKINISSNFLYIDADKLKFPLILRKWRSGDWFIPFGMKGRKKLSDFFTDEKYSLKDKENVWLLVSGEDVVWIVGKRTDDRYKITECSKNIIIIELLS